MKKLISVLSIASLFSFGAFAQQTVTVTLAANTATNVPINPGSLMVLNSTLVAAGATTIQYIDSPNTSLSYVNGSFTTQSTYVSNTIVGWTNYYGATNFYTNNILWRYPVVHAASTNLWPQRAAFSATGAGTQIFSPLDITFNQGLLITNSGANQIQIIISYVQ